MAESFAGSTCRTAIGWISAACLAAVILISGGATALAQRTNPKQGAAAGRQVRQTSSQAEPTIESRAAAAEAEALRKLTRPPLQAPFGALPPDHQEYLDKILGYWEHRSSQIERYRCKFQRWEYNPQFGPKDPDVHATHAIGVIKYAAPDKGLFMVEEKSVYEPPEKPGEPGKHTEMIKATDEHWVCDGSSVFEFRPREKLLVQRELPPDMRGMAIVDGPLPFLFGAKVEKIKARYWLRVVTPSDAVGEYWLEAWPKSVHDAGNFQRIEVILDEKDYLPKAIKVYDPRYDERTNPASTVYVFENREVNWNTLIDKVKTLGGQDFHEPQTPRGWKKIVEKYQPPSSEPPAPRPVARQPAKKSPAGPTAQRPKGKPR